jgi:adenylyltransferase/sulfurtransferase
VPNCADAGVLGVLPGVIGTLMAVEAIKLILGVGEPLVGRLVLYDALRVRFREIAVRRDSGCAACGDRPTLRDLIDYDAFCGAAQGSGPGVEVSAAELARERRLGGAPQLIDVREPWEWEIARIEGARLIPVGQLPGRLAELDPRREVVLLCHRGTRSLAAQRVLEGAGFRARSLAGGIDAWATTVDPTLPRY